MPLSLKLEKKYQRLLNNLLDLKARDPTTFTRVNNVSYFDLISKFGFQNSKKIFFQKNFQLDLKENDLVKLLKIVKTSDDSEMIIKSYEKYKEKLFSTQKLLLREIDSFSLAKEKLITKLKLKIQKTATRWQQFRRKVIDMNDQDGVWPLYLASGFVSLKTTRKVLYAPFFLKKVTISEITNSKIRITTLSDEWDINEKLLFFLRDTGFDISENFNFFQLTIEEIIKKINHHFQKELTWDFFNQNFNNKKREKIDYYHLLFNPGIVFGIFKPAGGHLRKTMLEIIKKNEVEKIIDPQPYSEIYQKAINEYLIDHSEKLIRIQPSNFSQDRAIISALLHDTIVWGPPGTGKSQVIANIIANVFFQNKTAVVISQKKAALDVLKKRLGKISPFTFFLFNDNKKKSKEQFYQFLQQFLNEINNFSAVKKIFSTKIISDDEIKALKILQTSKEKKSYQASLKVIGLFKTNKQLFQHFFSLQSNWHYPSFIFKKTDNYNDYFFQIKEYSEKLAKLNQIKKERYFFFFKKYPNLVEEVSNAVYHLMINFTNLNLNHHKDLITQTNINQVKKLLSVPKTLLHQSNYQSHENNLTTILVKRIINKIKNWRINDKVKMRSYKKFANAIRAKRRNLNSFISDHILIIKEFFPIIITTPETSFINWEKNSFDYAILDETSQIFLEIGLPVLYLAKRKILAGDRKQLKPSRWFTQRDDWSEEEDFDLEENAESVLDYVFEKGVYQIMLNKNYRSNHAALMSFSAKHFYDSKLDVADNLLKQKSKKAIEVINLQDGCWEKNFNQPEADKVLILARKNIKKYQKIIILTFNAPQKQWIEKKIFEDYPFLAKTMENERLFIRNIENVQGDEADLVIVSVVYDQNTKFRSTYVARNGGKNALNVALSRAKEKMIVIKSFTAKQMPSYPNKDYQIFKEWITFLDLKAEEKKSYSHLEEKVMVIEGETESNFEKEVKKTIGKKITFAKQVKLISQYVVGSKRIDLAILDEKNNYLLGIEVDGYHYHEGKGYEKYLEDFSRQEFLESKGYDLFRVKEIDWKLDQKTILKEIKILVKKKLIIQKSF